jgi:hypothetical protein
MRHLWPLRQQRTAYKDLLSMYPSTLTGPPLGQKIMVWQHTMYRNAAKHLSLLDGI